MADDQQRLRRLGNGDSIEQLCRDEQWSREHFDSWWQEQLAARLPQTKDSAPASVQSAVTIARDARGVPHIFAETDHDLFVAWGYAIAQDRLFQLDYLRRKGKGELAEILGKSGIEQDTIARTVGLHRIAEAEWHTLPRETQDLLSAFTQGINDWIGSCHRLPIEFDLLGYQPSAWRPQDCLAIESEFRWYLTGRLPVIAIPEMAKRTLGDGELFRDFLLGEADDESIVHEGEYSAEKIPPANMGGSFSSPDEGIGSNNWIVNGARSDTGHPIVVSDPHIAMEAVSCWYQVHLNGGSFNVAGMSYVGIPAIMFGRNPRVGWSITNNICSQRDLYQEKLDDAHPDQALFDDQWEPLNVRREVIHVRDSDPVTKTIRCTRNGPIVDELLPVEAQQSGPVSLNWLGMHAGGWLTAMLGMDRANDVAEFRTALKPWHVPTFAMLFADVEGNIAFQATGRVPYRTIAERGYRPGWDPAHQWAGLIDFEAMPHLHNPERGWMATANNRVAPDDYPQPMAGTWGSGHRAARLRRQLEESSDHDVAQFASMQLDHLSMRAVECVPALLKVLDGLSEINQTVNISILQLKQWDCCMDPDSSAALIFNVFFSFWCERVAAERFDDHMTTFFAAAAGGIANRLLHGDSSGWFESDREAAIHQTFTSAIDYLCGRFERDVAKWKWGDVHQTTLNHWLEKVGDLGQLLNQPNRPVRGDMITVGNTGSGPDWQAKTGGGYRLINDMSTSPPSLLAIDIASQSGQPGSPFYADQQDPWFKGELFTITLDQEATLAAAQQVLTLQPV